MDILTEDNFLLYAAKHYTNPYCFDTEEFYSDIKRFKYIKRLINRYKTFGDIKERLLLNHIIVLNNVFGPEHCCRMLLLFNGKDMGVIKPFLVLIGALPNQINNVIGYNKVYTADLPMDPIIVEKLREL